MNQIIYVGPSDRLALFPPAVQNQLDLTYADRSIAQSTESLLPNENDAAALIPPLPLRLVRDHSQHTMIWDLRAELTGNFSATQETTRTDAVQEPGSEAHFKQFREACKALSAACGNAPTPPKILIIDDESLSTTSAMAFANIAAQVPGVTFTTIEALEHQLMHREERRRFGWDSLVDPWIEHMPKHGNKVPSAYRIWQSSRRYYKAGALDLAQHCENLNYLLHNSYIPYLLDLEREVTFAYGGIGLIIHKDSHIHKGVTIGANSSIGGNGTPTRIDSRTQKVSTVPEIGPYVTIGAGVNISGGLTIGGWRSSHRTAS